MKSGFFYPDKNITVDQSKKVDEDVYTIDYYDPDLDVDGDTVRFELENGPGKSWIHGNILFGLRSGM